MMKPFRILTTVHEIYVIPNRNFVPIEDAHYPVVTFTVYVFDHDENLISESVVPDLSALWHLATAELVGGEEE